MPDQRSPSKTQASTASHPPLPAAPAVARPPRPAAPTHITAAAPENPVGGNAAASGAEDQRRHLRFDKVFPVRVESILFGELSCIARNVSAGGIFLETREPLPLGARIRVCFLTMDESGEIAATGEVKNHYFINYSRDGESQSVCGMAVRFIGFENEGERHLRSCLDRFRTLH